MASEEPRSPRDDDPPPADVHGPQSSPRTCSNERATAGDLEGRAWNEDRSRSGVGTMLPKMSRWSVGLLLACGLSALMHLVHPNLEAHTHDAPFLGGVRYAFNADSALFARLVVQFPQCFWNSEQGRVRILRPLYPALGRCVYWPLTPLARLIPESWAARVQKLKTETNHPEIWAGVDERSLLVGWAALIAVNFVVCWSSAA